MVVTALILPASASAANSPSGDSARYVSYHRCAVVGLVARFMGATEHECRGRGVCSRRKPLPQSEEAFLGELAATRVTGRVGQRARDRPPSSPLMHASSPRLLAPMTMDSKSPRVRSSCHDSRRGAGFLLAHRRRGGHRGAGVGSRGDGATPGLPPRRRRRWRRHRRPSRLR